MSKTSKFWKYFFITLGSIITLILITFLGYFIYYSVQLKYGNNTDVSKIVSQYESKFSSAIDKNAPEDVPDFKKLVQNFNPKKGEDNSKVTIIIFADFECPYCQESYATFNHVIEKYQPVTQVIFKNLPLAEIHPNAVISALAGTCANEQNKFWEYYDELYTSKKVDKDSLYASAEKIGLDSNKFDNCMNSQKYLPNIEKDLKDAVNVGLRGTPTYLINGEVVEGSLSQEEWDKLIIKNLNK